MATKSNQKSRHKGYGAPGHPFHQSPDTNQLHGAVRDQENDGAYRSDNLQAFALIPVPQQLGGSYVIVLLASQPASRAKEGY